MIILSTDGYVLLLLLLLFVVVLMSSYSDGAVAHVVFVLDSDVGK